MKRREIITSIHSILQNLEGVCSNGTKAAAILAEIETLGMLPAKTTKLKKYTIKDIDGPDEMYEKIEDVYEWEE